MYISDGFNPITTPFCPAQFPLMTLLKLIFGLVINASFRRFSLWLDAIFMSLDQSIRVRVNLYCVLF